ncbi:MAG TPA: PocR ligand-binding domain-containing protein, partial [Spirochaetia bacterium]|nr:PocR ligand-binding domain-containing protein [Spirochaetia bacterium]
MPPEDLPGIDLALLKRLGAEYRTSTRLPLLLVDARGRKLWSLGACPVCARLSRSPRQEKLCRDYQRRSVEESLRWGEPYISVCPFGLVTFAVPISRDKKLVAGMISGFCIFPQMKKDIGDDIMRAVRRYRLRARIGPQPRLFFRVITSERLRRDAGFLLELTARYGANDLDLIHESRERSIQQFTIANFLEDARREKQDPVSGL